MATKGLAPGAFKIVQKPEVALALCFQQRRGDTGKQMTFHATKVILTNGFPFLGGVRVDFMLFGTVSKRCGI